jgi:membrane associated rhomboid family serine protease
MPRNTSFEMGLPPFRGAVRVIILASVAIYVVILLLLSFAPSAGHTLLELGVLDPAHLRQGWFWQLGTYAFMYVDPLEFVLSLLGIYFLGWAVEERIGSLAFYGLFFSRPSPDSSCLFLE